MKGLLVGAALLLPSMAWGATPIVEGETVGLDLGGYASATTGIQHRFYDIPTLPNTSGLSASLLRFEWRAYLGDSVTVDVHNRFFGRVSSTALTGNVGLGSTIAPTRTLDLQTWIVDEDGVALEHDLDRLAVAVNTPAGDLTLGRQAVTWGVSMLFPVADFWTQFSPFELDTSQKRGVDAARFITYPAEALEVDAIVVDRGELAAISGGVRVGWSVDRADYHLMLARSYDTVWGVMSAAFDVEWARIYGEMALPLQESDWQLAAPRASTGLNLLRSDYTVSAEYHYNGLGSASVLEALTSPRATRGETYLAGRHYVGLVGTYTPREYVTFSAMALVALNAPSALVAPTIDYEIAPDVHARLTSYVGIGEKPDFSGIPSVPSEFGAYGESYFFELSAFF